MIHGTLRLAGIARLLAGQALSETTIKRTILAMHSTTVTMAARLAHHGMSEVCGSLGRSRADGWAYVQTDRRGHPWRTCPNQPVRPATTRGD